MENSATDCCHSCRAANMHIKSEERRKRQEEGEGPKRKKSRKVEIEGEKAITRVVELHGFSSSSQVIMTINAPAGFMLDLNYLPYFQGTTNSDARCSIAATSSNGGGLLLCKLILDKQVVDYLICYPMSKRWMSLPPAPKTYTPVSLGFIYDPCCCYGARHEPLTCSSCRLKVVRFSHSNIVRSDFQVATYSSETGEWTNGSVKSPKAFDWYDSNLNGPVFHNGCFHWLVCHLNIVVYDPFNNKLHGPISGPPEPQRCQTFSNASLGLSRGSLWLSQDSSISGYLRIWELVEGSYRDFDPAGHLILDDFSWRQHLLIQMFDLGRPWISASTLAFHPDDPHIIYAQESDDSCSCIVECNLRNKTLGQPKLGADYTSTGDKFLTLVFPQTQAVAI